jgi:Flp pilus assembly protein TadG
MSGRFGNQRVARRSALRRGAAMLELAICLPLLLSVVLGSIEATNAIFLQEHLTSAAYEGARSATAPGQTVAGATAAANKVLVQFRISGATVTITPNIEYLTPTGTAVTVRVSAPLGSNALMRPFIFGKTISNVTATVVMLRQ